LACWEKEGRAGQGKKEKLFLGRKNLGTQRRRGRSCEKERGKSPGGKEKKYVISKGDLNKKREEVFLI